MHQLQIP